jgi:hypothetical protein
LQQACDYGKQTPPQQMRSEREASLNDGMGLSGVVTSSAQDQDRARSATEMRAYFLHLLG